MSAPDGMIVDDPRAMRERLETVLFHTAISFGFPGFKREGRGGDRLIKMAMRRERKIDRKRNGRRLGRG